MFIRLLIIFILFIVVVHSAVTTKSTALDDDYDLNDKKTNGEGSGGGAANLDEYADEEDDQLSKITATTMNSSTSTTTTTTKIPEQKNSTKMNDLDADEFNEDYKDDLVGDVDYNEITTKISSTSLSSSTRPSSVIQNHTPIRVLFKFLTRPPIAAGILAGLAIGILTSVILLICLVQRFHKRQRTHSSYTTGLLYPNQYSYSKSPQEFYA